VEQFAAASCFAGMLHENVRSGQPLWDSQQLFLQKCNIMNIFLPTVQPSPSATHFKARHQGPHQTVGLQQVFWGTTEPGLRTQPYQSRVEKSVECVYVYFRVLLLMP
jgi:hypothetical protein